MSVQLTIDPEAVAENWRAFDRLGPAEAAAAVKADGYGLGADIVAPAFHAAGCRRFFVAAAAEARALLRALEGLEARIYVLNGAAEGLAEMAGRGVRPVLNTAAEAEAAIAEAARRDERLPCALQVETGMNRLGMTEAEVAATLALPGLERLSVEVLMSHLAAADEPAHALNLSQKRRFDAHLERLRPAFPDAKASLAATGGALLGPEFAYDLIRPGVGLYGGLPFAEARAAVGLEAPLLRVWEVEAGARSGYGGTWTAARPSRLATIPLGYADGISRALSGRGEAKLGGRVVPFAGRVSMDLIVLDVTDLDPAPRPGDRAVLLDAELTIDRMADAAGTIGYELLTRLDAAGRMTRGVGPVGCG